MRICILLEVYFELMIKSEILYVIQEQVHLLKPYYILMYINGKMRPAETTPGMGRGRIKENDGRG
jgi:hypothetical protein